MLLVAAAGGLLVWLIAPEASRSTGTSPAAAKPAVLAGAAATPTPSTPQPTPSPAPSAANPTPTPTPRPSPSATPATPAPTPEPTLVFGAGLDSASQRVIAPTNVFTPGSTLAYAINLGEPFGVSQLTIQVAKISGGQETTVQPVGRWDVAPDAIAAGVQLPADRLLAAWGTGDYVLRVFRDGELLVEGVFQLAS
jgi:hypothetical protein